MKTKVCQSRILHQWNILQEGRNRTLADIQKLKESDIKNQRCTIRNVKGQSSNWRKMMPDEKLDLDEGIKSVGRVTLWVDTMTYFSYYLNLSKINL